MRALVTGAAGFIGSTLVRRLTDEGVGVVGVDNLSPYYDPSLKRRNLEEIGSAAFRFVEADLNTAPLADLLSGADVVFHLAGQPGVRGSWGRTFDDYVSANIAATQRLLEAARESDDPPLIVYASSSSVYGEAEAYPTHERLAPQPRSPYGVTKLAGEHLCRLYAANYGLHTVSLRFFTVYGPRQRPDMAFTRFLRAAVTGAPIQVYGSGEQVRDFTFVDDIVDALFRAGTRPTAPGSVYNVSGGGSHSVNDVLALVEQLVGVALTVERQPPARGDVSRTTADIAAIIRDLDWSPRVALEAGLTAQLDWVRSQPPSR